jgi:hypothetical protein
MQTLIRLAGVTPGEYNRATLHEPISAVHFAFLAVLNRFGASLELVEVHALKGDE